MMARTTNTPADLMSLKKYSAKSADELAFRPEIQRLALSHPDSLRVLFAVTGSDNNKFGADVLATQVQDMRKVAIAKCFKAA